MRIALALLSLTTLLAASGCRLDASLRSDATHADGPGNSENAPGHNKQK